MSSITKPIGLILRKRKGQSQQQQSTAKTVSLLSIDEQIARLQNNNEKDKEISDNESSSADDDYSDSDLDNSNGGCKVEKDSEGNIIRIVSSIQDREKIQPLAAEFLPAARCNTSNASEGGKSGSRKRSIRFVDEAPTAEQQAISGMEKTVREMLSHYEPASHDKKPFFCRVCSHQSSSMEELEAHKLTEFHAIAVKVERTRSYCKHCEKQFTSPDQLKGHIEGKAHKEKVAWLAGRKRFNYNAPH